MKWLKDYTKDYVNLFHAKRIFTFYSPSKEWGVWVLMDSEDEVLLDLFSTKEEAQEKMDEIIKCIS